MRSRLTLVLLALSLPATDMAAQRVPLMGRKKTPERPAEKPPLMPGIHDSRLYSRYALSRFSFEQYPMVSYLQTNGFLAAGIPANYWTIGDGTHLGFRATPSLSMTTDFTSTIFGGPFSMGTAEFGLRVKPWTAPRVTPFVDVRRSWAYTAGFSGSSTAVPLLFMYRSAYGDFSTGSGSGHSFGVGADTRLSARFWLTTAVTHARFAMRARSAGSFEEWDYVSQATRLSVGVRYNHGRWLDAPR